MDPNSQNGQIWSLGGKESEIQKQDHLPREQNHPGDMSNEACDLRELNIEKVHEFKQKNDLKEEETIEALTECVFSSISKSKIQEMKIKQLESIIQELQRSNSFHSYTSLQNGNNRRTINKNYPFSQGNTPPRGYHLMNEQMSRQTSRGEFAYLNPQRQQLSPIRIEAKTKACKRHSETRSPQPRNISQSIGKELRTHSTDNLKDVREGFQQNHLRSLQGISQSYQTQSEMQEGMRQQSSPTQTREESHNSSIQQPNQFLNLESFLYSSVHNTIKNDYLSKLQFLEEAIEYKNQEIEKLMVLTAVSRKVAFPAASPPKQSHRSNGQTTASFASSVVNDSKEQDLRALVAELQEKNCNLESELFQTRQQLEEKDQDLLHIQEQIEQLHNCSNNQISFIRLSEELEERLKEKEQGEQQLLAKIEQQALLISFMEQETMKSNKKFDLIVQGQQQDQEVLREELKRVKDMIAAKAEEEKKTQGGQKDANELQTLYKKVEIQNQLLDKQKQSNDILKREISQLQTRIQEFEKVKQEMDKTRKNIMLESNFYQEQAHGLQVQLAEKENQVVQMTWQQAESKKKIEEMQKQVLGQFQEYEKVIKQSNEESARLREDRNDSSEILELKKQLMLEGFAKQELLHAASETEKLRCSRADLVKENNDLKQMLEGLKQKLRSMQNIDDDIKTYINDMCSEKNNLHERHLAHLEEIKNLKLSMKNIQFENNSLQMSVENLKEEILIYKNQQTSIQEEEKEKKSFLKQLLEKKLTLMNSQLETYIRTTLDLDEIFYIILSRSSTTFSSPQKNNSIIHPASQNKKYLPSTSSGKKSLSSPIQVSQDSSLGGSNFKYLNKNSPSVEVPGFFDYQGKNMQVDEKTTAKIEQLNSKRKRDLDKVYIIMEDFVSLVQNIEP